MCVRKQLRQEQGPEKKESCGVRKRGVMKMKRQEGRSRGPDKQW